MTAELKNDLYLRALNREAVPRTPVWVMRQAGRYLPEYLRVRKQAGDFMSLCSNPELACEVTLQPIDRFNLDAAILFSDILTIPDAMGLGLHFEAGEGPKFSNPIKTSADVEKLPVPDPNASLRYVMDAVSTIRKELNGRVPLIGFSGSPWTLATYMVEGGGTKDFAKIKGLMFSDPATLHKLLDKTAQSVISYLNAQVESGAQALMVFDTWGGVLAPATYREFSLRYMQQIVDGLTRKADDRKIPVVLFTKNGGQWLDIMADTDNVISSRYIRVGGHKRFSLSVYDELCRSLHIQVGPTVSQASGISRLPALWPSIPENPASAKPGQIPRD